jgi:hypothetical protein
MFHHRRPLRRWAACLVLLWLFGVGLSVANACAGTDRTASRRLAQQHDCLPVLMQEGSRGPVDSAAMANCMDFCDKASVSIPSLKSALDEVQGHALQSIPSPAACPVPLQAPDRPLVLRRDGVRAPSIPIAFLRLTL